jgi:hypothetical protein
LIPTVGRVVQQHLLKAALDEIATLGEPVNRVIEVDPDDDDVTFVASRPGRPVGFGGHTADTHGRSTPRD